MAPERPTHGAAPAVPRGPFPLARDGNGKDGDGGVDRLVDGKPPHEADAATDTAAMGADTPGRSTALPAAPLPPPPASLLARYRMRWRRRELLWRAFRSRRDLTPLALRLDRIPAKGVLVFCTLRNELPRLAVFLDHYRRLGAVHFLVVDNASTDGGDRWLADQPDVSIWRTEADYRAARYGMAWINHLLGRYGRGRWCLTVDTDELLVYPRCDSRDLNALTDRLDQTGAQAMGALMLDLFPRGRLDDPPQAGTHPLTHLGWFDAGPYSTEIQPRTMARRVRGGARLRELLHDARDRAPTLNKLPLVRWHWRMAYLNSTHSLLPPPMNAAWDGPGDPRLSGVLLHTKFTPEVIAKSAEDLQRRQHFADPDAMRPYYERIIGGGGLWHEDAQHLSGDWRQLTALKLMSDGGWT